MESAAFSNEVSISTTKEIVIFEFYYKDPKIGGEGSGEKILIKSIAIEISLAQLVVGQLNNKLNKPPDSQSGGLRIRP